MIFKLKYKLLGGHVHVRVFSGAALNALGLCGTLIFREEEWEDLVYDIKNVEYLLEEEKEVFYNANS